MTGVKMPDRVFHIQPIPGRIGPALAESEPEFDARLSVVGREGNPETWSEPYAALSPCWGLQGKLLRTVEEKTGARMS